MKRFIDSIIKILINTVVITAILALFFIAFIILLSKTNDISLKETISYVKSFGNEISDLNFTSKNSVNILADDLDYDTQEENLEISNNTNSFYYSQLDDNSKIIYDALEDNIDNLKKNNYTIDFSTKFNKLLNQSNGRYLLNRSFQTTLDAFFYDHPELFYIDITKISLLIEYTTFGSKTTYYVSICPENNLNYLNDNFSSESDVNKAIWEVEKIRDSIISSLPKSTNYTKALKIHDILVNLVEYDSSTNNINTHNIYGSLVEKKCVCEGYAKTFKYILDSLNIECILVSGIATNSTGETDSHMWNYIKLNGTWYGVDVTWDDPIIIGGSSQNTIKRTYFCKGSNVFDESHVVNSKLSNEGKSFSIPALSYKNYK